MADYEKIGAKIGALVAKKQAAYGDSFGRAGDIIRVLYPDGIPLDKMGSALTMIRVIDKLFRIATDKDAFGESPWMDIAGYAILEVAKDEKKEEEALNENYLDREALQRLLKESGLPHRVGEELMKQKSKPTPPSEPEETRFPELETLLEQLEGRVEPVPTDVTVISSKDVTWGGIDGFLARRDPFELLTVIGNRGSKQTVERAVAGVEELATKASIFDANVLADFKAEAAKAVELLEDENVDRSLVTGHLQYAYRFLSRNAPHNKTEEGKKWRGLEGEALRVALRAVIKVHGIDTGHLRLGGVSTDQVVSFALDNNKPVKNTSDPRVTRNKLLMARYKAARAGKKPEESSYGATPEEQSAYKRDMEAYNQYVTEDKLDPKDEYSEAEKVREEIYEQLKLQSEKFSANLVTPAKLEKMLAKPGPDRE